MDHKVVAADRGATANQRRCGCEPPQASADIDVAPSTTAPDAEVSTGISTRAPTVPTAATSTTGITNEPDAPVLWPKDPAMSPDANRVIRAGPSTVERTVSWVVRPEPSSTAQTATGGSSVPTDEPTSGGPAPARQMQRLPQRGPEHSQVPHRRILPKAINTRPARAIAADPQARRSWLVSPLNTASPSVPATDVRHWTCSASGDQPSE